MISKQRLAILGVTGSIGRQTLEVVDMMPEVFSVTVMTAGSNWQELARQALKYKPKYVAIAEESCYEELKRALSGSGIECSAGAEAICELVSLSCVDTVVSAIVGYAGLHPTYNAIKHCKKIALANKETLVVAGELVMREAEREGVTILPVDSEHSAIYQCLVGEKSPIEKILLTASGGPFAGYTAEQLANVTVEDALRHPNWVMGRKITIDSATLMNKGLEVIEAAWLFNVDVSKIEVLVHPKSVVHSMVQFADGAVKAQLGTPDMKLPIQYALTYPERVTLSDRLNLVGESLCFSAPDRELFPCLDLAYSAFAAGGNTACVMNAANEVAVAAFLSGGLAFTSIPKIIESTMSRVSYSAVASLDSYALSDAEARVVAHEMIKKV